ncbi:MAG: alanine racemase [Clostridia bacterium]|nr:alanine racemase [Clostridia bacterium]
MQKIKAKIHLKHIRENAQSFAKAGKKLCAVVKANAYGHGAEEVVGALEGVVDAFAVALLDEAIAIRAAACGKDILIFTPPTTVEETLTIAEDGYIATVPDLWTAKLLCHVSATYKKPIRVHLKVNTGMNRYGMNKSMLGRVCTLLKRQPLVKVEGIYTHLYSLCVETAERQRELFMEMLTVCKRYFLGVIAHMGGTYAALLGEKFAFDMVRVGLGLYGYLPQNAEVDESVTNRLSLQKGMTVYAPIVCTRAPSFGGVGYGNEWTRDELNGVRLNVCRFGYADGFLRQKSNGVDGWENNANALCMDVCIRKGAKKRGEWIPVLIDADETAKTAGTISYETLCAATRRAECVYDYE